MGIINKPEENIEEEIVSNGTSVEDQLSDESEEVVESPEESEFSETQITEPSEVNDTQDAESTESNNTQTAKKQEEEQAASDAKFKEQAASDAKSKEQHDVKTDSSENAKDKYNSAARRRDKNNEISNDEKQDEFERLLSDSSITPAKKAEAIFNMRTKIYQDLQNKVYESLAKDTQTTEQFKNDFMSKKWIDNELMKKMESIDKREAELLARIKNAKVTELTNYVDFVEKSKVKGDQKAFDSYVKGLSQLGVTTKINDNIDKNINVDKNKKVQAEAETLQRDIKRQIKFTEVMKGTGAAIKSTAFASFMSNMFKHVKGLFTKEQQRAMEDAHEEAQDEKSLEQIHYEEEHPEEFDGVINNEKMIEDLKNDMTEVQSEVEQEAAKAENEEVSKDEDEEEDNVEKSKKSLGSFIKGAITTAGVAIGLNHVIDKLKDTKSEEVKSEEAKSEEAKTYDFAQEYMNMPGGDNDYTDGERLKITSNGLMSYTAKAAGEQDLEKRKGMVMFVKGMMAAAYANNHPNGVDQKALDARCGARSEYAKACVMSANDFNKADIIVGIKDSKIVNDKMLDILKTLDENPDKAFTWDMEKTANCRADKGKHDISGKLTSNDALNNVLTQIQSQLEVTNNTQAVAEKQQEEAVKTDDQIEV